MKIFARFIEEWQEDLKYFLYWCLVFTLFRLAFILYFSSQLNGNYTDIPMALFLGLRLSFKTTGIICLIGFILATLPRLALGFWPAKKLRFAWHSLALLFFSLCFVVRLGYFTAFRFGFDAPMFNVLHDDKVALFITLVEEYHFFEGFALAFFLAAILIYVAKQFLTVLPQITLEYSWKNILVVVLVLPLLFLFVRFGGAFNYQHSIHWVSAARLNSTLLNEAILDDGQALYRARYNRRYISRDTVTKISKAELQKQISLLSGNANANGIDEAFLHTVQKPKLAQQPSNIFVIVGEGFGEWPFLGKFQNLGLTPKLQAMRASQTVATVDTMLANGQYTMPSINGLLTGLPDTGLYPNHEAKSYKAKYQMGIANVLKAMGYKTVFWYAGFSSWQDVERFALAQGFDEFYGADDFKYTGGSVWGAPDADLFKLIEQYVAKEDKEQKVFHFILTISNHAPFSIDVDSIGFPRTQIKAKLTNDFNNDDNTLKELGHLWYADKTMGEFVENMQAENEDALFVITGDHSERTNFAKEQDYKTISAVPCIFYGKGVQRDWFAEKSVGTHIQLAGTLAEIAAPSGFAYSAIVPSMFAKQDFVFNFRYYANEAEMNYLSKLPLEKKKYVDTLKQVAIYRVLHGDVIE